MVGSSNEAFNEANRALRLGRVGRHSQWQASILANGVAAACRSAGCLEASNVETKLNLACLLTARLHAAGRPGKNGEVEYTGIQHDSSSRMVGIIIYVSKWPTKSQKAVVLPLVVLLLLEEAAVIALVIFVICSAWLGRLAWSRLGLLAVFP